MVAMSSSMLLVVIAADVGLFGRWGAKGGVPHDVLFRNIRKLKILCAEQCGGFGLWIL